MSEQPFEDVADVTDESDTMGPVFDQVDKETQDNWNSEVVEPDLEDDEEEPA